ncbi:TetR/AcrR family transcriptional regulator [Halioglobus maricola]|uniref:TetR/AcrR family transcriptional regulator n=1 Tax=Halioglobus maricola TaxID=2601894 RepID=A0A5P9NIR3_9GAMM|nr:TetR/AcrR family transcriptional regulator [Halioglobus maricola]QFU75632.1 TetR/AcrR family transcriptional regulator [Halioglobus maricola]
MHEIVVSKRRVTPQQKAKRLEIIDETRKLLAEYGADISMEMVGAAAQVSRSTLYRYYVSREHLISEVTLEAGNRLVEYLEYDPPKGKTIGARTSYLCAQIVHVAEGSPKLLAACINNLASDDPVVTDAYVEIEQIIPRIFGTVSGTQKLQIAAEVWNTIFRYLFGGFILATTGKLSYSELAGDLAELCKSLLADIWDVKC